MTRSDSGPKQGPLVSFCVRLSPKVRVEIERRAEHQRRKGKRLLTTGDVVRELLDYALARVDRDGVANSSERQVFMQALLTGFVTRRCLEVLLVRAGIPVEEPIAAAAKDAKAYFEKKLK